jgi:hypothetical protein
MSAGRWLWPLLAWDVRSLDLIGKLGRAQHFVKGTIRGAATKARDPCGNWARL